MLSYDYKKKKYALKRIGLDINQQSNTNQEVDINIINTKNSSFKRNIKYKDIKEIEKSSNFNLSNNSIK